LIAIFSALLIGTIVADEATVTGAASVETTSTTTTKATVAASDDKTTTTTAAITTTIPPQKWIVRNTTNSVACVVLTAVKLELVVNQTTYHLLESVAVVAGDSSCSSTEDIMVIQQKDVTLYLTFSAGSSKSFYLSNINATIGTETFAAAVNDMKVPVDKVYGCKAERPITINNVNPNGAHPSATLVLAGIRVQALRTTNSTDLSSEGDYVCVADGSGMSNIVPIAVGCGLAGLIIIVLIAYMIGRRRAYNHVRE